MRNARKTPAADAAKKLERDIDRVAASIQRFRVDAQRYFAGDLKLPPEELRERITADLRRLRSASLKGAVANFRLGGLEAQFQSHLDLFGRRLRQRELTSLNQAAGSGGEAGLDPMKGVVLGRQGRSAAVKALYESLHQRNPKMDIERFQNYLEKQAEVIRSKTGCSEIQFRVAVEDGKMKLKAKPLRQAT